MKKWSIVFAGIFISAILVIAGCSGGDEQAEEAMETGFRDYKSWTLVKTDIATDAHMSAIKDLYVNEKGLNAFKAGAVPMPEGTIIVKENYMNNDGMKGDLAALTVMIKREPGYDMQNGNWEYVKAGPDFMEEARGKVEMCIACHAQVKDKDWLFMSGE